MNEREQIIAIRRYYTDRSLESAFKGDIIAFEKLVDWAQGANVLDLPIDKHNITLRQAMLNEYREFFFGRMSQWHARRRILGHIAGTLITHLMTHDETPKKRAVRGRGRKKAG